MAGAPNSGADAPRKWLWLVLVVALIAAALFAAIIFVPRVNAAYELYWGRAKIERLFYEDLGLSAAWSSFAAVVISFFYALAWVPLSLWTYRLLAWRFNYRQFGIAFASWLLVYGNAPLLRALLGTNACVDQRTGAPLKWYIESANGKITLFDSGGYDSTSGVKKRPVTREICAAFARQRADIQPRRINANVRTIKFFDPSSGKPRVWYSKAPDGSFHLFDASGFDPDTGRPLLPVTKDIVAEIMAHAAAKAARQKAAREHARLAAEHARRAAEEARLAAEPARSGTCMGIPINGLHLVSGEKKIINWGDYCIVETKVVSGCIELGSPEYGHKAMGPDCRRIGTDAPKALGDMPGFPTTEFVGLAPDSIVNYVLCPAKERWINGHCG